MIKKGNVLEDIHRRYIMYQLFRATKYLHSGSVIHRDLKVILVNIYTYKSTGQSAITALLASKYVKKNVFSNLINSMRLRNVHSCIITILEEVYFYKNMRFQMEVYSAELKNYLIIYIV